MHAESARAADASPAAASGAPRPPSFSTMFFSSSSRCSGVSRPAPAEGAADASCASDASAVSEACASPDAAADSTDAADAPAPSGLSMG
ncbi:hypothetical protein [Sutterella wadsworthensis]|uniref:hypothetical protein n=1 Tax=Sutterella wadsworthensis TaxID=40545 RepID=UPI0026709FAA|nr:hypothetical protein [Sutterella wadsworthensis]